MASKGYRPESLLTMRLRRRVMETEEEVWKQVRRQHAEWQSEEPELLIGKTAALLLLGGLAHAREVWEKYQEEEQA